MIPDNIKTCNNIHFPHSSLLMYKIHITILISKVLSVGSTHITPILPIGINQCKILVVHANISFKVAKSL